MKGPQYVCHACIGDRFLAKQVEQEGIREECTYCRATNTAITLADLSNRIHCVLEEHFISVPGVRGLGVRGPGTV